MHLLEKKEWLSIEEALSYARAQTRADFSFNDLFYYVVKRQIRPCWFLQHQDAIEVTLQCREIPGGHNPSLAEIAPELANLPTIRTENFYPANPDIDDIHPTASLDGPYAIDLEYNPKLEHFFLDMITGAESELTAMDGYFLTDTSGRVWNLLDHMSWREREEYDELSQLAIIECAALRDSKINEFCKAKAEELARSPYDGRMKARLLSEYREKLEGCEYLQFPDPPKLRSMYYPSDKLPNLKQIVFLKSDLDLFIGSFDVSLQANGLDEVGAKRINVMLRTIDSLLCAAIKGSTGRPYTDAEAGIAAMIDNGIAPPIKRDALAKYLAEARKLK